MKPDADGDNWTLHCGDAREVLHEMPEASVHCVVTSPPYWNLRDYKLPPLVWGGDAECGHEWSEELVLDKQHQWKPGHGGLQDHPVRAGVHHRHNGQFCSRCGAWRGSLGLEPTPALYVAHIVEVFREVKRVLRDDGCVFLNMGDCYASNTATGTQGQPGQRADRTFTAERMGPRIGDGLKPKELVGMPWRVAFALQADGWWLRSAIVWAKGLSFCESYSGSVMPESCNDRPTSSYEHVFLLTKSGKPTFWTHRDRAGTRTKPKPDYRWINQLTEEEQVEAPDPHERLLKVLCPECKGKGEITRYVEAYAFQWIEECERCQGKKTIRKWKRINLWRGHDYFYDAEAVAEAVTHGSKGSRFDAGKTADHQLGRAQNGNRNESGSRNLRSVWAINPQPWPKAHFATFAEALVEPCIKAGTSAKGCCPACGAPWARVVEKVRRFESGSGRSGNLPEGKHGSGLQGGGETGDIRRGPIVESTTIGWRPTCECPGLDGDSPWPQLDMHPNGEENWPRVPCTVLDPFVGSGTTVLVAAKLGRHGIGIDLSRDYIEKHCIPRLELPLFDGAEQEAP